MTEAEESIHGSSYSLTQAEDPSTFVGLSLAHRQIFKMPSCKSFQNILFTNINGKILKMQVENLPLKKKNRHT